jgi:hypothetical protein
VETVAEASQLGNGRLLERPDLRLSSGREAGERAPAASVFCGAVVEVLVWERLHARGTRAGWWAVERCNATQKSQADCLRPLPAAATPNMPRGTRACACLFLSASDCTSSSPRHFRTVCDGGLGFPKGGSLTAFVLLPAITSHRFQTFALAGRGDPASGWPSALPG